MKSARKNTLRAMGICLLAALMLAGCGNDSSTASTGSSVSESSVETTTAAGNETTTAAGNDSKTETTTSANSQTESSAVEENKDADFAWFATGVYKAAINGKYDSDYYVFYDKTSGKTTNGITGTGLPFACEQSKGSVIFHMGGIDNTSEMKMEMNESGKISGTMDGKTYVFTMLEGISADSFDAKAYEGTAPSEEESKFLADKKAAEINALDYVGVGYSIVSVDSLPSNDLNNNYFKVGLCPTGDTDLTFYLYAGSHACMSESEWLEKGASAESEFFADKRVAEMNVRTRVGSGYEIVSSDSLPNNDGANYFKVGVRKTGSNAETTYYYAGKSFCKTEAEWLDSGSEAAPDDGQNPIMNFIGNYSNGRAIMLVSGMGQNEAAVKITWGGSAFDSSTWTMSGAVSVDDKEMTITYKNCTKESYHFSEDGTLERDDVEYSNGTGKIRFNLTDNTACWDDDKENAGADSVFRYITIE